MSNKETCIHENPSYGRLNQYFIINCIDCKKVLRIDDMKTQLKILEEFKLSCECGKSTIIEQKNKETCKFSEIIDGCYGKGEPNYIYSSSCGRKINYPLIQPNIAWKNIDDHKYKFCPYCGKDIEEAKE